MPVTFERIKGGFQSACFTCDCSFMGWHILLVNSPREEVRFCVSELVFQSFCFSSDMMQSQDYPHGCSFCKS